MIKAAFVGVMGAALVVAGIFLTGCMPTTAIVSETPDNQSAVEACKTLAQQHNSIAFGDYVIGGLGAAAGGVSGALASQNQNPTLVTALAMGAAGAAALAAGGMGLAAFEASSFQNQQCAQFVGPLPIGPMIKPAAAK